jgi:hypothetical protein
LIGVKKKPKKLYFFLEINEYGARIQIERVKTESVDGTNFNEMALQVRQKMHNDE